MKPIIYLIAHNIRSTHNVGSIFRTSEGLGVNKLFLTGYSPYPRLENDNRLPHLATKISNAIDKTSLGSDKNIDWRHEDDILELIKNLKNLEFRVVALEQTKKSIDLSTYKTPAKIALILGNEVTGIEQEILALCDEHIEIPMLGKKESFNVVQAAAMTLYKFRHIS